MLQSDVWFDDDDEEPLNHGKYSQKSLDVVKLSGYRAGRAIRDEISTQTGFDEGFKLSLVIGKAVGDLYYEISQKYSADNLISGHDKHILFDRFETMVLNELPTKKYRPNQDNSSFLALISDIAELAHQICPELSIDIAAFRQIAFRITA